MLGTYLHLACMKVLAYTAAYAALYISEVQKCIQLQCRLPAYAMQR